MGSGRPGCTCARQWTQRPTLSSQISNSSDSRGQSTACRPVRYHPADIDREWRQRSHGPLLPLRRHAPSDRWLGNSPSTRTLATAESSSTTPSSRPPQSSSLTIDVASLNFRDLCVLTSTPIREPCSSSAQCRQENPRQCDGVAVDGESYEPSDGSFRCLVGDEENWLGREGQFSVE